MVALTVSDLNLGSGLALGEVADVDWIYESYNQDRETVEMMKLLRPWVLEDLREGKFLVHRESKSFTWYNFRVRDFTTTIYLILVPSEYRLRGIGRLMVNAFPAPIEVKVPQDNRANGFYRRLGFTFIKRLPPVPGKSRKVALLLYRKLALGGIA